MRTVFERMWDDDEGGFMTAIARGDVAGAVDAIHRLAPDMRHRCLHGDCYRFHLFLKEMFPDAVPYMNRERDHVVTRIGDGFYDATGRVGSVYGKAATRYHEMDAKEVAVAGKWGRGGSSHSSSALMEGRSDMACDVEVRPFGANGDDAFLHDAMDACVLEPRKRYREGIYRTMFPLRFGRLSTTYILTDGDRRMALAVCDDTGVRVLYDADTCDAVRAEEFAASLAGEVGV